MIKHKTHKLFTGFRDKWDKPIYIQDEIEIGTFLGRVYYNQQLESFCVLLEDMDSNKVIDGELTYLSDLCERV